jgi:heterodisulfide reductase subunit B2
MMRIGYYPGCSLLGSSREFDESVRALMKALQVELATVPDWNCCGASSAHTLDHDLSLALPARILALAERDGITEMLAPCAACSNRLLGAQQELTEHPDTRARIEGVIGMPFKGTVRVLNILEVLARVKDRIVPTSPFARKVACYYGCLLVRPARVVHFDRVENPQSMDQLMAHIGATPVVWNFKTECCGAAFSVTRTDIVARLSGTLLDDAVRHGAEAIVVACPMCHSNLDMRRPEINGFLGRDERTPVMFVTQAIGLAMGLDPESLGLHRHMVPVEFREPALSGAKA